MIGSCFLVLFFFTQALDVDGYGTWTDFTNYFAALKYAGLNVSNNAHKHDLKIFGDYTTTAVIINTDTFDEEKLLDFVNNGNSVVVILNEDSKELADFVEELGIKVSNPPRPEDTEAGLCTYTSPSLQETVPKLKCGNGFLLDVSLNKPSHAVYYPLLNKTLSNGTNETYAYAVQGVNDARIVVFSTDALLSDEDSTGTSMKVAVDLTLWAFRLKGLLRYSNLTYVRHADGLINVPELAINDNITFSIKLESFDADERGQGDWKPFTAKDAQLQYSMLVPRIRKNLIPGKNGIHSLTFRLPDIFGIYQFIVDYQPYGYTRINATHTVRMRPYRHNEFPRYLTSAYPYYTVALIMLLGVVVVSIVFVFHAPVFDQGVDSSKLNFAPSSSSSSSSSSSAPVATSSSSPSPPPAKGRKALTSSSPSPNTSKIAKKKTEGKTTTKKKE